MAEKIALRRAISIWAADGLLKAFTTWREGKLVSQLDLFSRAAAFWINRGLAVAWHTWRDGCGKNRGLWAIIHRLEMKHRAEKDELLAEIERLRKLLMNRDFVSHVPAFAPDDTAKLAKAMAMWQNMALARGFNTLKWELQMARANRSMALKVMTYWCNQKLVQAYNRWRAYYGDLLHSRNAARNAVMRWRFMQLFAAFNSWRSTLTDGVRRKNAMLRAILRWGGSELLAGFGYWRETAEKIRVAELEFRAYLTKSYDPTERSRSRSASPTRMALRGRGDSP